MPQARRSCRHSVATMHVALPVLALSSVQALAHHPTGGRTPTTLLEGFLSGLGHPVIGPDHLAFIVAIGIAAAMLDGRGTGSGLIAAFIAASTAGVLVHVARIGVPMSEVLVALSVIAAGGLLAIGLAPRRQLWMMLAALAGIVHGYVYGETVVGAEGSVVGAYLAGLAVVQATVAAGVMSFGAIFAMPAMARSVHLRVSGILLACIGVVMLAGGLLGE